VITALCLCVALLAGDDLAALEKKLKASDDRERAAAVTELAKIGSKEAWTLVIDALKDPAANVGDEAELQLAKLSLPELVEDLYGKRGLMSGDEKVQLRAAGIFGSLEQGTLAGAKLTAALGAKSVDVRRTLRASLERMIGAGRVTAPDRLVAQGCRICGPRIDLAHDDS
jgi:HEAT repeat protein